MLDGPDHHRAVRVARHADEARDLLVAELVEGLERAVRGLDLGEVVLASEAVQVQQVHVVGLEALEAGLHLPQRRVARARARGDLRGQEDVLAPGRHHAPDARLALAVAVVHGGIEVVDPEPHRPLQDSRGLVGRVHEEAAAAAHGQDRDRYARAAQRAMGERPRRLRRARRHRHHRQRGHAGGEAAALEELSTGDGAAIGHGWPLLSQGGNATHHLDGCGLPP